MNHQKVSEEEERQKLIVTQALDDASTAKRAMEEAEEAIRDAEAQQEREDLHFAAEQEEADALILAAAVELEREDWLFAAELEEEAETQHRAENVDSGIVAEGC